MTRIQSGGLTSIVVAAMVVVVACGGSGDPAEQGPPTGAGLQPSRSIESTVPSHRPEIDLAHGGSTSDAITWSAPEGWTEETPSSSMRKAQYRIAAVEGDTTDGECAVFYFGAGQGGNIDANVARWAGQFRSPEGGAVKPVVKEVPLGDIRVTRVEVSGTYTPSPMTMMGGETPSPRPGYLLLGAIVPGAQANWFFKCSGPEATMNANRDRFGELVASVAPGS